MFDLTQSLVVTVLWVVTLVLKTYAVVDCLRRPAAAFPAVGRQTKPLWLVLTGLAFLTGLVPGLTLSIVGIAAVIVAIVYVFDIRPRIAEITGRR